MKRFLALFLAMLMALSLVACGGGGDTQDAGDTGDDTQGAEETASTELNIYMWQQYISDQLVKDFE